MSTITPIPGPPNLNGPGQPVVTALMRVIIQQVPGFTLGMRVIHNQMLNQIVQVIKENIVGLIGSVLSTIGIAALLPSVIIATVNAIGFTSGGVLAGSIAAAIQSSVYGAYTGGLFSAFQSLGATAIIAPPVALALGGIALAAGAGLVGYWWWKKRRPTGSGSDRGGGSEGSGHAGHGPGDDDANDEDQRDKKSRNSSENCLAVVTSPSTFTIFRGIFNRHGRQTPE